MLFAKTSLSMPTSSLILIAAITPSAGIAGAVLFPHLQRTVLPWSNLKLLLLLVALSALVPLWGLVALRAPWQIYLLAVVFGGAYIIFSLVTSPCNALIRDRNRVQRSTVRSRVTREPAFRNSFPHRKQQDGSVYTASPTRAAHFSVRSSSPSSPILPVRFVPFLPSFSQERRERDTQNEADENLFRM
jgi:hypothetical protein